jgi:branched-chain amino acid transport system permease protein
MVLPPLVGDYGTYELALYFLYAIAALGLGLAWGQAGIVSLGQGLFVALATYLTAFGLLATSSIVLAYLILPAAAIICGLVAFGIAALIFRGRTESGPAFALITLALTLCGTQIAGTWTDVTGGFNGLRNVPGLPGLSDFTDLYYLAALVLAAVIIGADWLVRSPLGVLLRAIAQNERRLAFFGYRTPLLKAVAFAIAGGLAGIAGALYAPQQSLVTPDLSGFEFSGDLLIFAAVGGRTTVLGPVLGAIIVGALSAELRDTILWWPLVIAVFFILVVLRLPGGLTTAFRPLTRRLVPQRQPGAPIEAPGLRRSPEPLAIAFEDVHVQMGDVTVLDGLDLATSDERFLCVIGPNGAGKTSTLNVLTGALPKRSGRILIDGTPIGRPRPASVAALGVGRKFQTPTVFPDLTIAENVAIALWAGRARWHELLRPRLYDWTSPTLREMQRRFSFLLKSVDSAASLSHGERQILELTMALVTEPRLLLLDEPCAGLSHAETGAVIDAVRWAQRAIGFRTVVIEHDMDLVRRLADRVAVLHQGRLLAIGGVADIQTNESVQRVYAGGTR